MNKKVTLLFALSLSITAIIFIVKSKSAPPLQYQTAKVEIGTIKSSFYTAGTLAYRTQARLSSELVAKVTRIYVEEGETVKQGQELIKLDDSTVNAEISQMEAQVARGDIEIRRSRRDLDQKRTELERQSDLFAKGMISKQALDVALSVFDNAKFQLESSEKNALQNVAALLQKQKLLEKTVIRSPIQGVVIAIPIKVGETAVASAMSLAGSSLMTIADPNSMIVEAQVAEFDIARIKTGQQAVMNTRAVPNESFSGKVVRVGRSISNEGKTASDNKSIRTVAVQIELETVHPQFVSGMSCDLSLLEAAQEKTLLIPLTALRIDEVNGDSLTKKRQRDYYVWKIKDGRLVKNRVEIGFADEHNQEVLKGLVQGDAVITGPAVFIEKLRDGQLLTDIEA